jgi:hypothetical protein
MHLLEINWFVIGMLPATYIGAMESPTGADEIEVSCLGW